MIGIVGGVGSYAGIDLIKKNVELIILGCTEIPLAISEVSVDNIPIIDAIKILAYSLVEASSPAQVTLS